MKKEISGRGLFEKTAWTVTAAALALSCSAVTTDACCGGGDWLLDPSRYKAVVREAGGAWILENGLARREIATRPGVSTTSFKCLATGEEFVRGVSPEARVTFDGVECQVGGMTGQPVLNYMLTQWVAGMKPAPGAYEFTGAKTGEIEERFAWKQRPESKRVGPFCICFTVYA